MEKFDYEELERELARDRVFRNRELERYYRKDELIEKTIKKLNSKMKYVLKKGDVEIEVRGTLKRDILKNMLKEGYLPLE